MKKLKYILGVQPHEMEPEELFELIQKNRARLRRELRALNKSRRNFAERLKVKRGKPHKGLLTANEAVKLMIEHGLDEDQINAIIEKLKEEKRL